MKCASTAAGKASKNNPIEHANNLGVMAWCSWNPVCLMENMVGSELYFFKVINLSSLGSTSMKISL